MPGDAGAVTVAVNAVGHAQEGSGLRRASQWAQQVAPPRLTKKAEARPQRQARGGATMTKSEPSTQVETTMRGRGADVCGPAHAVQCSPASSTCSQESGAPHFAHSAPRSSAGSCAWPQRVQAVFSSDAAATMRSS